MLSLLRLERKQKNSSNPFRIRIFLFLSYSFGIETINTFIQSRSSLENHTRFGQNVHPFSDQKGAKTLPDGAAHTDMAHIREYPPGHSAPLFVQLDVIYIYFWQFSVFLQNILPYHADTSS